MSIPTGWYVDHDSDGDETIWDAGNLPLLVRWQAPRAFDVLAAVIETGAQEPPMPPRSDVAPERALGEGHPDDRPLVDRLRAAATAERSACMTSRADLLDEAAERVERLDVAMSRVKALELTARKALADE